MALVLKRNQDIVKMSHNTKNEVSRLRYAKVTADRQTRGRFENITSSHTWAVKMTPFIHFI